MHVLLFPSGGIGFSTSYVSRNMSYYNLYTWEFGIRMLWYAVAFWQLKLKFSIAAKELLKQAATSKNRYHYLYVAVLIVLAFSQSMQSNGIGGNLGGWRDWSIKL